MTAATIAEVDGIFVDLATTLSGLLASLAVDWQGWDGVRTWQSMGRGLTVDARHDGRGQVSQGVTLLAPGRRHVKAAGSFLKESRAVRLLRCADDRRQH